MINRVDRHEPLFLGIDTGGTYTDAVLWSEASGVVAKAKALTTRHDLAAGIGGAVDVVIRRAAVEASVIKLVSMSTTLATNALVEGQGGRVALVMIGFGEADLARDGLKAALGTDPVVFCPGGHDVHGKPQPLDLGELESRLPELAEAVSGFAICGYFATRNPGTSFWRATWSAPGQACRSLPAMNCRQGSAVRGGRSPRCSMPG